MKLNETSPGLILAGLNGANPLGFLAAVGAAITARGIWSDLKIHWQTIFGSWLPVLTSCEQDQETFLSQLNTALRNAPMQAFEIDGKLPFSVEKYISAMRTAVEKASRENRQECDFLAAFGTDMYPESDSKKSMNFQDTRFRMVRSGDSAGQGLPIYARAIREATSIDNLRRTLFRQWDYQDTGFSLRWDPLEDQRYALRWRDPSKSGLSDGPGVMVGANSLAIEALQFLPTVPVGSRAETTGFHRIEGKGSFFCWPIWTVEITPDTVRSLLALPDLHKEPVPREELAAMGITEIFRSQRIQQNQYYSNFAPSHPA